MELRQDSSLPGSATLEEPECPECTDGGALLERWAALNDDELAAALRQMGPANALRNVLRYVAAELVDTRRIDRSVAINFVIDDDEFDEGLWQFHLATDGADVRSGDGLHPAGVGTLSWHGVVPFIRRNTGQLDPRQAVFADILEFEGSVRDLRVLATWRLPHFATQATS